MRNRAIELIGIAALLLLAGCPNASDGRETELEQSAESTMQRGMEQSRELARETGKELKEFGAESSAALKQAGDEIQEGYASISQDVREDYPEVTEAMQRQFYAMNAWAVEEYRETFTPDAPRRDVLVEDLKVHLAGKPRYTVESFKVLSASDKEAKAQVVLRRRGTDKDKPMDDMKATYIYTFRPEADGDDWKVYDIQPAGEGMESMDQPVSNADSVK